MYQPLTFDTFRAANSRPYGAFSKFIQRIVTRAIAVRFCSLQSSFCAIIILFTFFVFEMFPVLSKKRVFLGFIVLCVPYGKLRQVGGQPPLREAALRGSVRQGTAGAV